MSLIAKIIEKYRSTARVPVPPITPENEFFAANDRFGNTVVSHMLPNF